MDFHEVVNIVSRATSNEPIVMQIALLFGLTSEAIRLVGEATPRANEITRQAMEYFEAQLASDVVQVGGLVSVSVIVRVQGSNGVTRNYPKLW